jgi:uncharacterized protein
MSELLKKLNGLYKLQLIDNEIIENMRHLRRLKDNESDTKKRFLELSDLKGKIDHEVDPIKQRAKEIKDENMVHLEKKRNCEDRLFNADTDPRDLQFLQKEREQVINLIKKNEDELVRLMVSVDNVEIRKRDLEDKLSDLEPTYNTEVKEREEKIKQLSTRVEQLRKERVAFRDFKDKSLLSLYQELQKTHDGVAIVTVNDEGVCDGCFVEVPKATLQKITDSEDIVTCQRCGRILYYTEGALV